VYSEKKDTQNSQSKNALGGKGNAILKKWDAPIIAEKSKLADIATNSNNPDKLNKICLRDCKKNAIYLYIL